MLQQIEPTIAVLMTCHNQVSQVLRSLEAVYASEQIAPEQLHVYLVDDGSDDGTYESVRQKFPLVSLHRGSGELFWNQGMRTAFESARLGNHDYHLWLNSDTVLARDAIAKLVRLTASLAEVSPAAIVSGSTVDADTCELTSSAYRFRSLRLFMSLEKISPPTCTTPCDTVDGTCLLVPREIYQSLGNLSGEFRHSLGDIDYGLRARNEGFRVFLAPGIYGKSPTLRARQTPQSISSAFEQLRKPLGIVTDTMPPIFFLPAADWWKFLRKHCGYAGCIPWLGTYLKLAWLICRTSHVARKRRASVP